MLGSQGLSIKENWRCPGQGLVHSACFWGCSQGVCEADLFPVT